MSIHSEKKHIRMQTISKSQPINSRIIENQNVQKPQLNEFVWVCNAHGV